MPLHEKDSVRDNLEDEVYASADLSVSMPKYKFPKTEQDPRLASARVCAARQSSGSLDSADLGSAWR
jgi:hypothetical protein